MAAAAVSPITPFPGTRLPSNRSRALMVFLEADLGHSTAPSSRLQNSWRKVVKVQEGGTARMAKERLPGTFQGKKEDNRASDPQAPTGRLSLSSEPHENRKPTKARLPGPPPSFGGSPVWSQLLKSSLEYLEGSQKKTSQNYFWRFPYLETTTSQHFVEVRLF